MGLCGRLSQKDPMMKNREIGKNAIVLSYSNTEDHVCIILMQNTTISTCQIFQCRIKSHQNAPQTSSIMGN